MAQKIAWWLHVTWRLGIGTRISGMGLSHTNTESLQPTL